MIEKVYRASNPRVIFTSAAVLTPRSKDLISTKIAWYTRMNVVVQTVGQTLRHLERRIKEHVLKWFKKHVKDQF